jgi:hypothetical protein
MRAPQTQRSSVAFLAAASRHNKDVISAFEPEVGEILSWRDEDIFPTMLRRMSPVLADFVAEVC